MSRYYEYDTIEDEYPNSEFVKVDKLLDLDVLRTDPHRNLMRNPDIAGAPEGDANVP